MSKEALKPQAEASEEIDWFGIGTESDDASFDDFFSDNHRSLFDEDWFGSDTESGAASFDDLFTCTSENDTITLEDIQKELGQLVNIKCVVRLFGVCEKLVVEKSTGTEFADYIVNRQLPLYDNIKDAENIKQSFKDPVVFTCVADSTYMLDLVCREYVKAFRNAYSKWPVENSKNGSNFLNAVCKERFSMIRVLKNSVTESVSNASITCGTLCYYIFKSEAIEKKTIKAVKAL